MSKEQELEHLIDRARILGKELHKLRNDLDQWCAKLADLLMILVNLRVYFKEKEHDED